MKKNIYIIILIFLGINIGLAGEIKKELPEIKENSNENLKIEAPLPSGNIIQDSQKEILAQNYKKLADMYNKNQDYTRAFYNYKKAYELEKKEEYIYQMAAMLFKQNKRSAAKQLVDDYYKLKQDSMLAERIGLFFYQSNEYTYAKEYYEKALYLRPSSASVHYNLGLVYFKIGDLVEAEKEFTKSIEYNVGFYQAYYNLALVYFQQSKLDKAKENFKKALSIKQDDEDIYFNLGIIYIKENNDQAAIESFEKALLLDKDFKEAAYNLAVLYKKNGQIKEAEKIISELEKKSDLNIEDAKKGLPAEQQDTGNLSAPVGDSNVNKQLLDSINNLNKRLDALSKSQYKNDQAFEEQKTQLLSELKKQILSSIPQNINSLFDEKIKDLEKRQIILGEVVSKLKNEIKLKGSSDNKNLYTKTEDTDLKNKINTIVIAVDNLNTAQKNNSQTISLLKNQVQQNSEIINSLKNIESNNSFLQLKQDIEDIEKNIEEIRESSDKLKQQITLISNRLIDNENSLNELKGSKDSEEIIKKIEDISSENQHYQENTDILIKQLKEKLSILEGKMEFLQLKQSLEKQGAVAPDRININSAGYDELMTITGMSSTTAQNILWYRQNIGYFKSIEELQKVPSMTYQIYQIIKDYVTIR